MSNPNVCVNQNSDNLAPVKPDGDPLVASARAAAEEIAVKLMRSLGRMFSGVAPDQSDREALVNVLVKGSDDLIRKEFSESIAYLSREVATIIERHCGETKIDGAASIVRERQRQIAEERWSAEHDDRHTRSELALVACAYALPKSYNLDGLMVTPQRLYDLAWWDQKWFKRSDKFDARPESMIPNLVKAGALIAAEIDRLERRLDLEKRGAVP